MRSLFTAILFVSISFNANAEEIRASLAVSATNSIFNKIKEPFEKATGIKIIYTSKDPKGHGAIECYKDVDDGTAEIGVAAISQFDWPAHMEKNGYKAKHAAEMKYQAIGRDLIYIFVNKSGPDRFTDEQLRDIFSGKISNFKDLGGPNQPIVVVEHAKLEATKNIVLKKLKVESLGAKQILIKDPETVADIFKKIGSTPGAMGWGVKGAATAEPNVKIAQHDLIGRPVTMIYRGDKLPPKIKKLTDFIANEGPKYGID